MGTKFTAPVQYAAGGPADKKWFNSLEVGNNPDLCKYFNDFIVAQDYAASDWVITTVEDGSGSATEALVADEACGALVITNDDASGDRNNLQHTEEVWRLASGKKLWFETRCKVNETDTNELFFGLAITDTTCLDATDKAGFLLTTSSGQWNAFHTKNGTGANEEIGSATDNTYSTLGFYWNGNGAIEFYKDRVKQYTATTGLPDDENLCVSLQIQNGAASARSITIDYIFVAQER